MEVRPKPRIWNGVGDYDSDDDDDVDQKPTYRSLFSETTYGTSTSLR